MKRSPLRFLAALSFTALIPLHSAQAQYSSYAECSRAAEDKFYADLANCANSGWGDPWLREICQMNVGQIYDADMQTCSNMFPDPVSFIVPAHPADDRNGSRHSVRMI